MRKWMMFALCGVACLSALSLLLFYMPQPEGEEVAPEGVDVVRIVATNDFKFDQPEYKVKKGKKIRLKLTNKSGLHGVAIDAFQVDLKEGQLEKDIVFDQVGKYEMYCSVLCGVGHDQMKSFLIVE